MNRPVRNRRPPARYGHENALAQSEPSGKIPFAGSTTMPPGETPTSYDTDLPLAHWITESIPAPPASPEMGVAADRNQALASRNVSSRAQRPTLRTFDLGRPTNPILPTPSREMSRNSLVETPVAEPNPSNRIPVEPLGSSSIQNSPNNNVPPVRDFHPHIPQTSSSDPGENH